MKANFQSGVILTVAGMVAAGRGQGAGVESVDEWIKELKSADQRANGAACDRAAEFRAAGVKPLAGLMTDSDFEVARRAKRALYRIVRHAGRLGATAEALAVEAELTALLGVGQVQTRREVLWMLSEIGTARAVAPMAELLIDKELREDARCALTRMPVAEAVGALKAAFAKGSDDFKPALAESLRARGQKVKGYPSRKLVPSAKTTVKPVEATGK